MSSAEFVPEVGGDQEPQASTLHVVMVSECSLDHASGVTTSVVRVADYLESQGNQVTVICPSPAPDQIGGAEVISTKSNNIKGFDVGRKSKKGFKELFRSLEPDVIHGASPMKVPKAVNIFLGGNAIKAADELDIPIAAVYQTDAVRFAKLLGLGLTAPAIQSQLRKMHNRADLNLVPSTSSEQDLQDWGIRPETIVPWGRGVDTALFNPERRGSEAVTKLREEWAPNGETIIGIVSRLEPEKSLERLIALKFIPDTRLVVIGKGTQAERLKSVLGDSTVFTGRLNGEDLANAYAALDIFPYPSTTDTFAQVVQEAKASGVPVVAANRGGPRDLVEHGVTGFLYEPGRKRTVDFELREYVEELVDDAELRCAMGEAARTSVLDRTWQNMGAQIEVYYRQAINLRKLRTSVPEYIGELALI